MKKVFILRGIPGSGKTTHIKKLADEQGFEQLHVVSADDFFMRPVVSTVGGGNRQYREYQFDPRMLPQAHASCLKGFLSLVKLDVDAIAVDNTNIHRWEYQNYEAIAKEHGYEVEIVEIMPETLAQLRECAARNVHKVPQEVVARLAVEFESDDRATVIPIGYE